LDFDKSSNRETGDRVDRQNLKKAKKKDEEVIRVVKEIKKAEIKVLRGDEW